MSEGPGQLSGHAGLDWARWIALLVAERGSLAALAQDLCTRRGDHESAESVERALRRLRGRGHQDGGVWGQRVLRAYGTPRSVLARARWMGQYHQRFTDLPVPVCEELLRLWDRPPLSASPARVWIQLGLVSVELRSGRRDAARERLAKIKASSPAARAELLLLRGFVDGAPIDGVDPLLLDLQGDDLACIRARLVDQRAYPLNRGPRRDHAAAYALYASLPEHGPPFAVVRRHNGLGWSALKLGRAEEALLHARTSLDAAGDGGFVRLRVMALQLLERCQPDQAPAIRSRARDIARRLEDEILLTRLGSAD